MEVCLKDPFAIRCVSQVIRALSLIHEDLIIVINREFFDFRALNETNSALPSVTFKKTFCDSYMYRLREELGFKVTGQAMITAFKNVTSPISLKIVVIPEKSKLQLSLLDKFGIMHEWEFYVEKTEVWAARYDSSGASVRIECKYDIFDGVMDAFRDAFREGHMITLEVSRENAIILKSAVGTQGLYSEMTICGGEQCDIRVDEAEERRGVSFSVADFVVAVKIAKVLNQRMTVHIGANQPIVLKAAIPGKTLFEMVLATSQEATELPPEPRDRPSSSAQPMTASPMQSPMRTPMRTPMRDDTRYDSMSTEEAVPAPVDNVFSGAAEVVAPSQPRAGRMSQLMAQGLFTESPPFPTRRKMNGQYAEDSQPPSDEDSDA